uniref:Uncharacterized protein n=1 Tax=Rhizophora mucronata TaxID=61149 RepID=A0A2P2LKA8_RHIMU
MILIQTQPIIKLN